MNNKIIIGLIGEISSGKGTVAKYLEKKYGASSHRFSTPLRDVLTRLYTEINRENLVGLSKTLRELLGQDLLAKVISKDVNKDHSKIVVVDGIRRMADLIYLKELQEFKLAYITADIKIRYDRIIKRGENADDVNKTFEQFVKDHQLETELEIPKIGATADIKIDNNGNIEKLHKQIDAILNK